MGKWDWIFYQPRILREYTRSSRCWFSFSCQQMRAGQTGQRVACQNKSSNRFLLCKSIRTPIFTHVTSRSLWAFCSFPVLPYLKKKFLFSSLWFISFSLKSPGTLKELVRLNVSWNVWGWWELCFVNLSPKPSDVHHAAEGELVCKKYQNDLFCRLLGWIYLLWKLSTQREDLKMEF